MRSEPGGLLESLHAGEQYNHLQLAGIEAAGPASRGGWWVGGSGWMVVGGGHDATVAHRLVHQDTLISQIVCYRHC